MSTESNILLETGTNEFEIVEFTVGSVSYGINVAKVREVINMLPVTQITSESPCVDGVFELRGKVIPMVNLAKRLGSDFVAASPRVIVCEINNYMAGFKVDEVSRIHRISWTQLEPSPHIVGSDLVVGIIKMPDKLIVLLDFEKILAEINPEINRKLNAVPVSAPERIETRKAKTILIAEDSPMLRELLDDTLKNAGYKTISTENGKEAWDRLSEIVASRKPVNEQVQLVVTDIEMPQMDGHHLTKRIKESDDLKHLPVIIFSSLINEEMRRKGESIGVDAQITKPEIAQLISIVDQKVGV
jgi:two-component system chemotaxis response regulator CheV